MVVVVVVVVDVVSGGERRTGGTGTARTLRGNTVLLPSFNTESRAEYTQYTLHTYVYAGSLTIIITYGKESLCLQLL